ncbi:MAG: sugar phosphate isomerase/epimerase family protein [Blastocatellia bacterium]
MNRRDLLTTGALAAAAWPFRDLLSLAASLSPAPTESTPPQGVDPWRGLKIGVATYTLRTLPIEAAIAGVKRVGLQYVSIKNVRNHIDLTHTTEERKQRTQMFRDAGITPLSVGNVGMKTDEAEMRRAFEYAKEIGVTTMVCAPQRDGIPLLDKLVKEYDIRLAIHNHGPEDKQFPSPYDVMSAVEKYDKRLGLCIDVGHTARAGVDPAESILKCRERLYDVHLKDIYALGPRNTPIENGRGILNIPSILQALVKIKFQGLVGFEYEKDGNDPVPGLAESVGYTRGVLASIKA